MNRFFDIDGDKSTQLAPWELIRLGLHIDVARFRLEPPALRMRSDIAGGVMVIQPGTISDLASIPRPAWSIFMASDDPRIALAAWFHDEGYRLRGRLTLEDGRVVQLTRKQMDQILAFEAMPDLMATRAQQLAVYHALRLFGNGWPGDSLLERLS